MSIGEASEILGVSSQTVRNLVSTGQLGAFTLPSGHRRFNRLELVAFADGQPIEESEKGNLLVSYSRCSTLSQAKALESQIGRVREFCETSYPNHQKIHLSDNSSGANFQRKGIRQLLEIIESGRLDNGVIVAEFRDRIGRMAVSLIEQICEIRSIQLVYIEQDEQKTDEQLMFEDITALLHVFNCKNYSKRGTDRLRKPLSVEAIELGQQLHNQGKTLREITETLNKKGFKHSDGSKITMHGVRTYIAINETLKRVAGKREETSLDLFAAKMVKKAPANHRVIIGDCYTRYVEWCKSFHLAALNKKAFCIYFRHNRQVVMKRDGVQCRSWCGVDVDGVESRIVSVYTVDDSPLDYLLNFLGGKKGWAGRLSKLTADYHEWAKERKIDTVKRVKIKSVITQFGAKVVRTNNSQWVNL